NRSKSTPRWIVSYSCKTPGRLGALPGCIGINTPTLFSVIGSYSITRHNLTRKQQIRGARGQIGRNGHQQSGPATAIQLPQLSVLSWSHRDTEMSRLLHLFEGIDLVSAAI